MLATLGLIHASHDRITMRGRKLIFLALSGYAVCFMHCRGLQTESSSRLDSSESIMPDRSAGPAVSLTIQERTEATPDEMAQRDGFRGCMRACYLQLGIDPGQIDMDRGRWCSSRCGEDRQCVANCQALDAGHTMANCRLACLRKYPTAIPANGRAGF